MLQRTEFRPGRGRREGSLRVPVRVPLSWHFDGETTMAWTADISRHGLSVQSAEIPPLDVLIQVELVGHLPRSGFRPVSLMAQVCWWRDNPILAPPSTQFGARILAFRDRGHAARYEAYYQSLAETVIVMEV